MKMVSACRKNIFQVNVAYNRLTLVFFSSDQPETLAAFTGYSLSEIVPCLNDLHKACLDATHGQLQAIKEKYKHAKYVTWKSVFCNLRAVSTG